MSTRLLVGRDDERQRLREALETACAGSGRVVLLGGEAGIGKTALIRALAKVAMARDIAVHTGYCTSSRAPAPYGPWIELVRVAQLTSDAPRGAIAGLAGESTSADIFQEIEQLITSARPGQPIILVLEDLHWADQASLDLFLALARHIERMPLLLAGTYRPLDSGPEAPFTRILPELHRLDQVERLTLTSLDLSALSTLTREQYRLNPADAGRLARYLLRYAGGNPFYTTELLGTLEHQGFIRAHHDGYQIGPLHEAVIPPIVQQLVQTRIANIDSALLRPLQAAAVLGERFAYDHWLALCRTTDEELKRALAAGVDARIFVPSLDRASLAFSHALLQETLYQTLPPPERRTLHHRIADMLIDQPQPDPDAIAHHLSQCDAPAAIDWLIQAGDRAYAAHAWVVARERFQDALSRMDAYAEDSERRGWLLYRLAMTERWEHEARSIEHLEEAESIAHRLSDRLLEAYCAFFQGSIYWFRDECKRARPFLDASVDLLNQSPAGGDVSRHATTLYGFESHGALDLASFNPIEGSMAVILASGGWHREALDRGHAFLETYADRPIADSTAAKAFGDAHNGIGASLAMLGDPVAAAHHFDRAFEIFDQPNLKSAATYQRLRFTLIPYFTTNQCAFEQQLETFDRLNRSIEALFTFDSQLFFAGLQHRRLLMQGNWNEAELSAITYRDFNLHNAYGNDAIASLAELQRLRGSFDRAWASIHQFLPDGAEQEPGSIRYMTGLSGIQTAVKMALGQGNLELARSWLQAHERWLSWSDARLGWADHRLLQAEYHLVAGDLEHAETGAKAALKLAGNPEQPLALINVHRLLGALAHRVGDVCAAASHLEAASKLADQSHAQYELALVEIEQIALALATGEKTPGVTRKIEAIRDFLEHIGAAPALSRLAEIDERHLSIPVLPTGFESLTAREIDVLKLVAAGLPNADIARRLSISPRTVTTHLSSIYRKLETSSRTTITRIAIEHGLSQ